MTVFVVKKKKRQSAEEDKKLLLSFWLFISFYLPRLYFSKETYIYVYFYSVFKFCSHFLLYDKRWRKEEDNVTESATRR